MLTRNRIILIVTWAGFLWGLYNMALGEPVSQTFWINAVYTIGFIAVAITLVIAGVILMASRIQLTYASLIGLALSLIITIAMIESFLIQPAIIDILSH